MTVSKLKKIYLKIPKSLFIGVTACFFTGIWLFFVDRFEAVTLNVNFQTGTFTTNLSLWAGHGLFALLLGFPLGLLGLTHNKFNKKWLTLSVLGLIVGGFLFWLGHILISGDWISKQSYAQLIPPIGAISGIITGIGVGLILLKPKLKYIALTGSGLLACVMAYADATVFPGLYPDIHLGFYITCAFFSLLFFARLLTLQKTLKIAIFTSPIATVALLAIPMVWFLMTSQTKSEVVLSSASGAKLVSLFSKPTSTNYLEKEINHPAPGETLGAPKKQSHWLKDGEKYNVILLVNDALRADAVPPVRKPGTKFAKPGDTPFMDAWLGKSFRFSRAYAQASRTSRSMPPMFQSLPPYQSDYPKGISLPKLMSRLGRTPIAIVPQYFLMPLHKSATAMMDGFEAVAFYEKNRQNTLLPKTRKLLQAVKGKPFFAWIHFYNMHLPYYGAKGLTKKKDGNAAARYRIALKWLDTQIKQLVTLLQEMNLDRNTIIIFNADHGESLGEHRSFNHGLTVLEEGIHIPLAIFIPKKQGKVIYPVVGNIDIVPTILDLINAPAQPEHRGHSLVPLLAQTDTHWNYPYYIQSGNGKKHAIVQGQHKLVFDTKTTSFFRYDLTQRPKEVHNLFNKTAPLDNQLLSQLARANPALFKAEFSSNKKIPNQLMTALEQIKGNKRTERLEFLLKTAALHPTEPILAAAQKLFFRATHFSVKMAVIEHLFAARPRQFKGLITQFIQSVSKQHTDQVIGMLNRFVKTEFATGFFIKKLETEIVYQNPSTWDSWLTLILPWKKANPKWVAAMSKLLQTAGQKDISPQTLGLLLDNWASLGRRAKSHGTQIETYLTHFSPTVVNAACKALAASNHPNAATLLYQLAKKPHLTATTKQAVMLALAEAEGTKAIPTIIKLGQDRLLTVDAIKILKKLKSEKGRPFLQKIAKKHYNSYTRNQAKKALRALKK